MPLDGNTYATWTYDTNTTTAANTEHYNHGRILVNGDGIHMDTIPLYRDIQQEAWEAINTKSMKFVTVAEFELAMKRLYDLIEKHTAIDLSEEEFIKVLEGE